MSQQKRLSLTEVECEQRTYRTWLEQIEPWWAQSQWQCHFLVSDGAPALIKLAVSGLGCVSGADLFHAMRALGQPFGSALGQRARALSKQQQLAEPYFPCTDALAQQQRQLEQDQQTYHSAMETISLAVHPFSLGAPQWQLGEALTARLAVPLQALAQLVPITKGQRSHQAIATFESHLPSWAEGIHAWWQWATQALAAETSDSECQNWVLTALLPWLYWSQQADKTRQPTLKQRYQQATSDAFDQLFEHPLTLALDNAEQCCWVQWGRWITAKYQRTSSAVEGRNGYLSQRHHVSRGFSEPALKSLTIIHNFDLKRPDGSTAAQRLFGHDFPDLFEWVLGNFTDLPMPRRSSQAPQLNAPHSKLFPA
ncbi:DUF6399 domain-containing protein [Vasconcelosia minhoensis]|uniref:DUF6399 domain-containing protein n=1 Tax=Vasconcelosia minhoensis TaxID=3366354 RepID=UPI001D15C32E|nr:DUF6399 domain-containing protein [Romeria gracilis]